MDAQLRILTKIEGIEVDRPNRLVLITDLSEIDRYLFSASESHSNVGAFESTSLRGHLQTQNKLFHPFSSENGPFEVLNSTILMIFNVFLL